MFERLDSSCADDLRFTFNGTPVICQTGDTVAAALLAAGHLVFRQTPVSGVPRGPFCMMGSCFECLVVIGGVTVQACQTVAYDGASVNSPPSAEDIL